MHFDEEIVMEDKAILRAALKERRVKQKDLAMLLGMAQNALSSKITRDRMSVDTFRSVLNELGYDVAVVDRENGEVRWVIDPDR